MREISSKALFVLFAAVSIVSCERDQNGAASFKDASKDHLADAMVSGSGEFDAGLASDLPFDEIHVEPPDAEFADVPICLCPAIVIAPIAIPAEAIASGVVGVQSSSDCTSCWLSTGRLQITPIHAPTCKVEIELTNGQELDVEAHFQSIGGCCAYGNLQSAKLTGDNPLDLTIEFGAFPGKCISWRTTP